MEARPKVYMYRTAVKWTEQRKAIISSAGVPHMRGTFMGINSAVQSIAASIATFAAGCIMTTNARGMLEHYNIVGGIACTAILGTIWLVGHIKVATTIPTEV